ncbi:AcrR family transcriptional regulator [Virgibacillus natechei]|uniref:AcrR family transcriptional regulator n=1 Tax=Virgibacillus natechei TaxID=1216297 RepID=A0ABS4II02_9BACI|nr:TetR/AcrR family transcriptional regulator [Virgibacillus natechei]MBP1969951.1 AcrR family transcriptional regulator [Virgibacillus natechei]UZD13388.1 TetR/AcrR family transcriptional regulator [Virgibacillus natechei]
MHTKEKILASSIELFAVNGYAGTSMAKIADKVGIKKPSLYAHYKNKEALFIDVTKKMVDEYVEFVRKSLDVQALNIKTVLYESFKTHVHDLARNDASIQFYNRFMQYPPKGLESELTASMEQSEEKARMLLEIVVAKGQTSKEITTELNAKSIARTYFCLIEGLANETTIYTLEEVEHHAESVWNVFWRGIRINLE